MLISLFILNGVDMDAKELDENIKSQIFPRVGSEKCENYKLVKCVGVKYDNENYLKVLIKV